MTRRSAFETLAAGLAIAQGVRSTPVSAGRLKQSVARWCYAQIPIEELCRAAAGMGLAGIDLVASEDWPVLRKYGLIPTMVDGAGTIKSAWNRKENHDALERRARDNILKAAAANVPNVITFSGNREGMNDDEGKENCILGLRRVKKFAEDHGVTMCLEVLNSKVNHKDYQCDHTQWAVDVIRGVDSPRVKILYDIYHMQIMEGDLIRTIHDNIQHIAHFHTGGVPGRHELDETQEINWRTVATSIADLRFEGFIAHEFVPKRDPLSSLRDAVKLCTV